MQDCYYEWDTEIDINFKRRNSGIDHLNAPRIEKSVDENL